MPATSRRSRQRCRGAKLLYLENPTSMVFDLQEIGRLAALAKAHGAATIIDNSWATPLFQQPLKHGIDLVVHSASKYLSGHSDTVAGVIAGSAERIARVNDLTYPYLGGKLSPFEAWLLVRGMRTLPLRMRQHQESGLAIAGAWPTTRWSPACCTRCSPTTRAAPR